MAVKDPKAPNLVPINGSTNVYVGQRYVPKFYDDGTEQHGATWDKTKVYEPLTIVLWEGDSYTSRTFVPAGVEISNAQYWLQTGVFNAQLAAAKAEINAIQNELSNTKKTQIIILGEEGIACNSTQYIKNFFPDSVIYSLNDGTWSDTSYVTFFNSIVSMAPTKNCDLIICGGFNDRNITSLNTNNMAALSSAYKSSKLNGRIYFAYDFWNRDSKTRLKIGESILPNIMRRLSDNNITFLDGLYLIAHNYDYLDGTSDPKLTSSAGFYYAQCLWSLYKSGFPNDWPLSTLDMEVNTNVTILGENLQGEMVPTIPAGMIVSNGCFVFKTYQTEWTLATALNTNKIRIGNLPFTPGKINFFKPDNRFYCPCVITANNINIPCWLSADGTSIFLNISNTVSGLSSFTMHPSSNMYSIAEF